MNETAKIAGDLWGDKLYQRRAREALPLLVRQAEAGEDVYYSELADELGMSNARNLNYPLGSIGVALKALSEMWGQKIPPLQCLVVNRATGLPGEGIGWFVEKKEDFRKLPRARQRRLLAAALAEVYAYPGWRRVLRELELPEPSPFDQNRLDEAARVRAQGEGEGHRRLKEHVAAHPGLLGLHAAAESEMELPLPSGDVVDVLFRAPGCWHVAKVKPATSGEPDLLRGLFQCVKYRAVIEAWQATLIVPPSARAVLILEGELPRALTPVKNVLGVEVVECVQPG